MQTHPLPLPSTEEVERAEYNFGVFSNDLETILAAVREATAFVSLKDHQFMETARIQSPDEAPVERETLLRLLVFADDLIGSAESMREQAAELSSLLRWAFHERPATSDS